MSGLVLIVEDEALLARNIKTYLERRGHQVETVDGVVRGLARYTELQPDIVLVDHNLPDGTGLSLISEIRRSDRWTKLVMITAYGGIDVAVAAMKSGADDYLTKPASLDEIALIVDKLMVQARIEGSLSYFNQRDKAQSGLDRIIGNSGPVLAMKQRIRHLLAAERAGGDNAAQASPPVLVMGDTGTGKELVARALHFDGVRAAQPFIAVNCAALPDQLVESELFGHERGAFTGAGDKKVGLFQAAEGGTLFLDEIGELPLPQQAKLLKAIEDKAIRPVGSVRERPINVRFIAATNAALEERSRQSEFRSDLLFRLNTITIEVPPLRHRGDDILLLAEAFVGEFQLRYGRSRLSLTPGARAALLAHPWPGNIRELRNAIEQACLMCARNAIEEADLNLRPVPALKAASDDASGRVTSATIPETERTLITEALRDHAGNVTLAARKLGVSRDTLRYRMEKHGLRRDGKSGIS